MIDLKGDQLPPDAELIVRRYARAVAPNAALARRVLKEWRKLPARAQLEAVWKMRLWLADARGEDVLKRDPPGGGSGGGGAA